MYRAVICIAFLLSATIARAGTSSADEIKLIHMLAGKSIVCDLSGNISEEARQASGFKKSITFANKQGRIQTTEINFGDPIADVEISRNWIVLSFVADATIAYHYHIQYSYDGTDLTLGSAVLNTADDQAGGEGISADPLDCSLKSK